MTKEQAILAIKEVQNGKFDRYENIEQSPLSEMAKRYWDDSMFSYGMEYGFIVGLMRAFDIQKEDL